MSWDTFAYDKFLPIATSKLSTDKIRMVSDPITQTKKLTSDGPNMCAGPRCPDINSPPSLCVNNTALLERVQDGPKYQKNSCDENCGDFRACQYCTTILSVTDTCGNIDGKMTCTLGTNGLGNLADQTFNTGWGFGTTYPLGWAVCRYLFDFTGYNEKDISNGPSKLNNWLTDIYKGVSTSAPNGITNQQDKTRIRDSNIIFGLILDFYNQIYFQGIYSDRKTPPTFATTDILSDMQNFTDKYVTQNTQRFGTLYDGPVPDDIKTSLKNILQPPRPFFETTYKISMNISYQQFIQYKKSTDPNSFTTVLFSNFLRDFQGTIQNNTSGSQYKSKDPILKNSKIVGIAAIELDQSAPYQVKQGIQEDDFVSPDRYPSYMFCTAQIEAEISVWSPMTAIYFRSYAVDLDDNVALEISRSGINGLPFPMPTQNFLRICSKGTEDCKNLISNLCGISYIPPPYTDYTVIGDYLMTDSSECMCYTSRITPVGSQQVGNQTAMCFDDHCDQVMKDMFGLTDGKCSQTCSQMYGWLNNKGQDQPGNLAHFDDNTYRRICGGNYVPYSNKEFSSKVLTVGIVCSIITGATVFLGCLSQGLSTSAGVMFAILGLVISGSVTGFLTVDYGGIGKCEGNNFVCRSRITGRKISDTFCNFSMNCECDLDSKCGAGCVCASTTCIPRNGDRTTVQEKEQYTDGALAFGFLIGSILLAFSVLFASKVYKWGIGDSYVYGASGILVVVGILLVVLVARGTKSVTRFTSACA